MTEKTEVLFNGECPICSREVNQYARMSEKHALPIRYDDLSDAARLADWGITAEDAARRFHVRKDGQVTSGIPAFILLWQEIPQMRWLAKIINLPVIHWAACTVYDYILGPMLYRFHMSRQKRGLS